MDRTLTTPRPDPDILEHFILRCRRLEAENRALQAERDAEAAFASILLAQTRQLWARLAAAS